MRFIFEPRFKYTTTMKKIWFTILLVFPIFIFSQSKDDEVLTKKVFVGYASGGMNLAQIAGDLMAGYDKIGVNAGVGAFIMYKRTPSFSNSIEISYSMRGAQIVLINKNPERFINYKMDYVQIPFMFNYHDGKIGIFSGGFTLGRLIRSEYIVDLEEIDVNAAPWDLAFTGGLTFLIKKKLGIGMNATLSLTNAVKTPFVNPRLDNPIFPRDYSRARNNGWYHNVLALKLYYIFW